MQSKAAVIHEPGGQYVIETIDVAPPKANEVLVKVAGCGLCHTDELGQQQVIPVPLPAVLGHEGSGEVVEVGASVTTVKPGDHVVLSYASCGHCETCLSGKPYVCNNFVPLNFTGVMKDGTKRLRLNDKAISNFFGQSGFAEYAVADERNVVPVDKDVDLTLLGPLGCGFQTGAGTVLNGLKPGFGSSIVVFGTGSVGCSAIMAAKIVGCKNIIAVDIVPEKLKLAEEIGATHTINGKEAADVVEEIKTITNGGADFSIETTGLPEITNQALYSLKILGTCAVVGVSAEVTIHVFNAIMMEGKTMKGFIEGNAVPQLFVPKLVEYYKAGKFPIDKLVTVYELADINKGFDDTHKGLALKAVVKM